MRKLALTSVYPSMDHCSPTIDAPSSLWIAASATLTMVMSMVARKRLEQQISSTRPGRMFGVINAHS